MVNVEYAERYKRSVKKIRDIKTREKLGKLMGKIIDVPTIGKPMRYKRKGTREIYMKSFRISYAYEKNTVRFLEVYHKDEQ